MSPHGVCLRARRLRAIVPTRGADGVSTSGDLPAGVKDIVSLTRKVEVSVGTGEHMAVDVADWWRIRRNVESLGEPLTERATTIASILIGAGVSLLGLAIALEHSSPSPSSSLLSGLWVAAGASILFAPGFFLVGLRERRRYRLSNRVVCDDMDDVAQRLNRGSLIPAKRANRPWKGIKGWLAWIWWGDINEADKPSEPAA
jgi:hypothetical protein